MNDITELIISTLTPKDTVALFGFTAIGFGIGCAVVISNHYIK